MKNVCFKNVSRYQELFFNEKSLGGGYGIEKAKSLQGKGEGRPKWKVYIKSGKDREKRCFRRYKKW